MPTFTVMYEDRNDAERVQSELERLGIIDTDGMNMHDRNSQGFSDSDYSSGNNSGFWGNNANRIPDEDRHTYEEGVRRGHYVLTVNTDEQSADRVRSILENSNAADVDEKAESWKKEGWQAPAAAAGVGTAATAGSFGSAQTLGTDHTRGTEEHIPVVEEQLVVGKREVNRGGARVRSYVEETPVQEHVHLREEHVEIERRPVNQRLDAANLGGDAFRDREIEVTETSEEAVVGKEARVVEEVVVRKEADDRLETVSDTVRRTNVDVDRIGDNDRLDRDRDDRL